MYEYEEPTFNPAHYQKIKDQYRHAQLELQEIEKAADLKTDKKAKSIILNLYYWAQDENIESDVWELIRSELRRIGEEKRKDLIKLLKNAEIQETTAIDDTFEQVAAIDWLGEEE